MAQCTQSSQGNCCFPSRDPIDPTRVEHIVLAGGVCGNGCQEQAESVSCRLTMIYFPFQQYRAGFEPSEALCRGTLFPELASSYPGGKC